MFKVSIKISGVEKYGAEFKTLPECETWIADNYEAFPVGYVADITDVSAQRRKEKRVQQASSRISFGSEMMAEIVAINEERLELGTLTEQQFAAMLADPILFKIERCLWNGSLQTAKVLIQSISDDYFTAFHKEQITDKITAFLLSIGEA